MLHCLDRTQVRKVQKEEYLVKNACYSVTKYYLCKQNNKRSLLGRIQRLEVVRSFPNRYQFSCINKVTSLFSDRYIFIIIFYNNFREAYREHLSTNSNLSEFSSSFTPLNANQASIEQLQGLLATEYEDYITSTDCNIGYMFRYIFNTIKFVTDDPYNQYDLKSRDRYLNLLQAQLSNEELCLIFYDAISKYGKNKEGIYMFKELLDNTHFLENIDASFLLDKNHYKLYPHTVFKFLNRDEIARVLPSGQ